MAREVINVGAAPNDGQGDPIRTAYIKTNNNFAELYSAIQLSPPLTLYGSAGNKAGMIAYSSTAFYYCFLDYDGVNIIWGELPIGVTGSEIVNGTSNVSVTASSNVTVSIAGVSNVAVFYASGFAVTGNVNVSANVTTGNVSGTTGAFTNVGGTLTTVAQNNITSVGALSSLAVTGNITAGNANASGNISATFFKGDGGYLTNVAAVAASSITNGTSSIAFTGSGGNAIITIGGTANIGVWATTGVYITGLGNATGNLNGANLTTPGVVTATGNLNGNNATITNAVVAATGTFSGNVSGANINTNSIVGTAVTITSAGALALAPTANITVNSKNINLLADPVLGTDAATKNYVDTVARGLNIHEAAYVATTSNLATATSGTISYNNGASGVGANLVTTGTYLLIDGGNVQTVGTRILVKNEANQAWNGVYTYSNTTVIVRATDFDTATEVNGGDFLFVTSGSTLADTGWVQVTDNVVFGTSNIAFDQFSGVGTYQAGTGLTLTDQTFSVNASQTQVTSVGTLTSLAVTGNASVGNISATNLGNISSINLTGSSSNVLYGNGIFAAASGGGGTPGGLNTYVQFNDASTFGGNASFTYNKATNTLTAGNIGGTLTTAAQTNITSVGTLTSLAVTGNITSGNIQGTTHSGTTGTFTGNITSGNLSVGTGVVTLGGIVNANANGVGNIGSSTLYFNTVFAKATSAQYADLAEMYQGDHYYSPGTVVCFGGSNEVTIAEKDHDVMVAGIVSTRPAYTMNSTLTGPTAVAIALAGRVPCNVQGPVLRGQMLVTAGNGRARAELNPAIGTVIGKALQDFNGSVGAIEIVVGRL